MNELPEPDNDLGIRHLLAESGTGESPELLEGLRRLRSFRSAPAPKPTGELAALLAETPAPPPQRPPRHRGLILSFALAGAMAAGTTGVAANNDLRLATDTFSAHLIEQMLPGHNHDEPQPPAQPPDDVPLAAGDAAAEGGAGGSGGSGGEPAVPGTHLPVPAVDAGGQGAPAAAETPPPADNTLPAPAAEPAPAVLPETAATPEAPAIPEASAEQPGKSGGAHPSGIHPGQGRPADGHNGRGRHWPGDRESAQAPGQGRGSAGPAGPAGPAGHSRESAHPNNRTGQGP
ncbi:hypothetical protein [Arthrobacter sp. Z1-15]